MIKDKLVEAVKTGLDNMKKGNDNIPLNMHGELEVIVKDRDGNVLSYERGCNQVTNLAKMAIIHLLAGEIGVEDDARYSTINTHSTQLRGASKIGEASSASSVAIYSRFVPSNHGMGYNNDGILVSEEQFFYDGSKVVSLPNTNHLSQVNPLDENFSFNFPTKMLFGTGMEAYDTTTMDTAYSTDAGTEVSGGIISRLNGYNNDAAASQTSFFSNSADLTNWYSNSAYKCRTLQPSNTEPKLTPNPSATDTAISGAIKNCLIQTQDDSIKYNPSTHMATPDCRGTGYPCFIYAKRSTQNFYNVDNTDKETYYEMNNALNKEEVPYETELTYTVVMPAQAVGNTTISAFYPYNGWILKQAGLFSDARYVLRSNNVSPYSEDDFINKVNGTDTESDSASIYRNSIGGQMLFTRNLSSPIIKTPDNVVTFIWHIFVAI